jgi:hypothetical protein
MNTMKATIRNRRIELNAPDDLPDGTEVLIGVTPVPAGKIGLDESEWRDDPAALADWEAWIKTLEPLEYTPAEVEAMSAFDEQMRQYNLEVVRKQMAKGDDE